MLSFNERSRFVSLLKAVVVLGLCPASATAQEAYDFIVVGGGTAGLALATRLSQRLSDSSILVVEAGPEALNEPRINIPGLKGSTIGTIYDWNFTTVAQPNLDNRKLGQARGKVLGGSQALNLMTWDRGAVAEYDGWGELGNPGWNWNTMIAAMERAETFHSANTSMYGDEGVGFSGPVDSVINRIIPAQQDFWIPTVENMGIPENLDSLGGDPIGVMDQPSNIDPSNYTRSYVANAYLPEAGASLTVMTDTRVAKVNLEQCTSLHATGITLQDGTVITANKEVILSSGSFQSPGLLELSGIGQTSVLTAAGIPVLEDLPGVGENLQDHLRVSSSYILKSNYSSFDELKYNATYASEQMDLYEAGQPSEYDYTGSGYSFITWQQALNSSEYSSLLALAPAAVNSSSVVDQYKLKYLQNRTDNVAQLETIFSDGYTGVKGYPAVGTAQYGINTFSLISVILHPFSRGNVHINSSSITSPPIINPNYLATDFDQQSLKYAARHNRQVAQTAPLSSAWTAEYEPGLQNVTTDAEWLAYAQNNALTIYHPVGTCAMLPQKDGGVVSPDLVVYGTDNLRVVDGSIIPVIVGAHLQTSILGIAEMAADRIVAQWSS